MTEFYVDADLTTREFRLRRRGEIYQEGLRVIDDHPVEQEIGTILPMFAQQIVNGGLPDVEQVDYLLDSLLQLAGISSPHTWIGHDELVRILPEPIQRKLALTDQGSVRFGVYED